MQNVHIVIILYRIKWPELIRAQYHQRTIDYYKPSHQWAIKQSTLPYWHIGWLSVAVCRKLPCSCFQKCITQPSYPKPPCLNGGFTMSSFSGTAWPVLLGFQRLVADFTKLTVASVPSISLSERCHVQKPENVALVSFLHILLRKRSQLTTAKKLTPFDGKICPFNHTINTHFYWY